MTRDDDYTRDLLREAEASDDVFIYAVLLPGSDAEDRKRYAHAKWLSDAGLFEHVSQHAFRITDQGHNYLAAIRNDTTWQRTKDAAASIGGVGLGVMKDIAVAYFKQEASQRLGITLG